MEGALEKPICFVVGPFGTQGDEKRAWFEFLLNDLLGPAIGDRYQIISTLSVPTPGDVMARIRALLNDAAIVVADLTYARPNVFYEIGWRQALEKPTVLVRREGEPSQFDLSTQETISISAQYREDRHQYSVVGLSDTQANLKAQVAAAVTNGSSLTRLNHEVHRARFFDWNVTYASGIATDWLQAQSEETTKAIEQYENGGGIPVDDRGLLRKFAEYLELKGAATQKYSGKLFYILDTESRETVFGYGLFNFPNSTLLIEAGGLEDDDLLEIEFRQPSRKVDVSGREIELSAYRYTVNFARKSPRGRRLVGTILHPQTKTMIGDTELIPFPGRLG